MSITIEEMNIETDWPQVQKLLESTPMTASIPLVAVRPCLPSIAYPVINGKSFDLVAKKDGKVLGFIHGRKEVKMAYDNGIFSEVDWVYLGDFRVDLNARRLGIASKLRDAVQQYCVDNGIKYGWSVVFAKNKPMLRFYDHFTGKAKSIRNYCVVSRLIMGRPKKNQIFNYERFLPSDYDLAILAQKLSKRFLGPVVSASDLQTLCKLYPEIQFYRHKNNGEIAFALWDQSKFKNLLLAKMPLGIRLIRWVWNFIALFTASHSFPKAGEAWRSAELTFFVENKISSDFEAFVVSECYDMGCHTLNLIEGGLGGDYPNLKIRGPSYRVDLKLMSYSIAGETPLTAPEFILADVDLGFV